MAKQISTSGNNCGKQRVARNVFWRGMLHWVIFHATRARFATKARKFVQCNGGLSFPVFSSVACGRAEAKPLPCV